MVMNVLEEHSGSVYTGHHDGCSRSRQNRLFLPYRLQGPISDITQFGVLILCVFHFVTKIMYTPQAIRSPVILHYTFF